MSIASRITDAIDAIAAAFNARNAPGPSDFQMWVAADPTNRATATIADYRQAMIGPDEDYAGYLNGLLATPPRAGAATEAQTGVTQFATDVETAAGAIATKAVSPFRLAGAIVDILSGGRLGPLSKDVTGGDWNNVITTGFYRGNAMLNTPGGGGGWNWVIVQAHDGNNWQSQIAHTYTVANGSAVNGQMFQRFRLNGTWQPWTRLIGTSDLPVIDGGTLNFSTSWNSLSTPGTYLFNGGGGTPQGFPTGAYSFGMLMVLKGANQGVVQVYTPDGRAPFWRSNFNAGGGPGASTWYALSTTTVAPQA